MAYMPATNSKGLTLTQGYSKCKRCGQQTEKMDPATQTEYIRDEQEPSVTVLIERPDRPAQRQPDAQTNKKNGTGVNFGLSGVEPECVRTSQRQGGDHAPS